MISSNGYGRSTDLGISPKVLNLLNNLGALHLNCCLSRAHFDMKLRAI